MKPWLLSASVAFVFAYQAAVPRAPSSAEELVVRDREGRVRLRVGLLRSGIDAPGIELFDKEGRKRASLALAEDGTPALVMNNRDGNSILALEQDPDEHFGSLTMIGRTSQGTAVQQARLSIDPAPEGDMMRTTSRLVLVDRKMNATELPGAH